jgi:hypothetical protein
MASFLSTHLKKKSTPFGVLFLFGETGWTDLNNNQ